MPELLHVPCSHVMTACRNRNLLYESSRYMSRYYTQQAELNTWEPKFEPLLDPSKWPEYHGLDYVPDVAMRKTRKGRRKKRRFRNEMDDMEKGYGHDMYGFGDFNQDRTKVRCSVCHEEGHRLEKHKEGPSKEPKKNVDNPHVWYAMYLCSFCVVFMFFSIYFIFILLTVI